MAYSLELEQAVLEVLYQKCLNRPLWVSESEVFWNISDVRVTEREVREILEQLVYHRRVVKQVGKYQISKAEFLSIKGQIASVGNFQSNEQLPTEDNHPTKSSNEKKTSRVSVQRIVGGALLLILLGIILGLFFAEYNAQEPFTQTPRQKAVLSPETPRTHVVLPNPLSAKDELEVKKSLRELSVYLQSQQKEYAIMASHIDSLQGVLVELKSNAKRQEQAYQQKIERLQYLGVVALVVVLCFGTIVFIDGLKFYTKKALEVGQPHQILSSFLR